MLYILNALQQELSTWPGTFSGTPAHITRVVYDVPNHKYTFGGRCYVSGFIREFSLCLSGHVVDEPIMQPHVLALSQLESIRLRLFDPQIGVTQ